MLKRTALYNEEKSLGARFIEFAGWELPLYYTSIIDESMAVRQSAGIFDISHLGKILVRGKRATEFLQYMATNNIARFQVGRGAYTFFCNDTGGILDDDILYRFDEDEYVIIANAARVKPLIDWLKEHNPNGTLIVDRTDELSLLALQGPKSPELLQETFNEDPSEYKRYSVRTAKVNGDTFTIMRSGYTGEEGFEILCDAQAAEHAWRMIVGSNVMPAGLGARDTLRLEMGFPLYGNDISISTNPIEAGLEKFVAFEKGEFIGRTPLLRQAQEGVARRLVGFIIGNGIPRMNDIIFDTQGIEIGRVTSGGYSPVLKKGIGMGYVKTEYSQVGTDVMVKSSQRMLEGRISMRPFIKPQMYQKGAEGIPAAS